MKKLLILTAAIVGMCVAQADTFYFTSDHATGGFGGEPPFGSVVLTQDGTSVDVIVTLTAGYRFVTTGSADQMYFKFNATGIVTADITDITTGLAAYTGALNGDGTGQFQFGIAPAVYGQGINPFAGPIGFTVLNATIADLTHPNNLGMLFVADLIAPAGQGGRTGPADVTGPGVPDGGSTIALLGLAMLGLGSVRRVFAKK